MYKYFGKYTDIVGKIIMISGFLLFVFVFFKVIKKAFE